ncbi:hypothetical protein LDENG_00169670 [Lucifuga dentata]|nr:hypothetical protein LDENG_00169670 [Lucifuga dentata]
MLDLLKYSVLLSLYVCPAVFVAVAEGVLEIKSVCGADCALVCTAEGKPGVRYRSVRWYKVGELPAARRRGLVTWTLPNGTLQFYAGLEREVEVLEKSRDIFLPNLTNSDSGVYVCHLAAPVGEQNQEGQVLLSLSDCPDHRDVLMVDTLLIFAVVALLASLVIFLISYGNLRNLIRDRIKPTQKEVLLDGPLKPLEPKELKLMYTLGPNWSKTASIKHVCV